MTDKKEAIILKDIKSWEEALEKESWVAPPVDVYESEDEFVLVANLPGVDKYNVKVKLEEDNLILMGRIDYESAVNRNYILKETETGNYYRKFHLSENVDSGRIEARFENGQLIVNLPKHEKIKPKDIQIK